MSESSRSATALSPTPRTDAAAKWDHEHYVDERGGVASVQVVRADFARQLERELIAARSLSSDDMVPLSTISECPSCDGKGHVLYTKTLFTEPTEKQTCWRCKGSGRVMAYTETKEQFDARMKKVGAFVEQCNTVASADRYASIPNGWKIEKDGDALILHSPGSLTYVVHPEGGDTTAREALFALVDALFVASSTTESSLTFDTFRRANVTRCLKWHPAGIESWSPSDWLTAVTGELGELASLLKMRNRERDGLPGNKFSPTDQQIADEIADVLTYLDLLAAALDINLGKAAVEKFNAVSERVGFPDRLCIASATKESSK